MGTRQRQLHERDDQVTGQGDSSSVCRDITEQNSTDHVHQHIRHVEAKWEPGAECDEKAVQHLKESSCTGADQDSAEHSATAQVDGGTRAWLVVLGAWCVSFCSYGWINSESVPWLGCCVMGAFLSMASRCRRIPRVLRDGTVERLHAESDCMDSRVANLSYVGPRSRHRCSF